MNLDQVNFFTNNIYLKILLLNTKKMMMMKNDINDDNGKHLLNNANLIKMYRFKILQNNISLFYFFVFFLALQVDLNRHTFEGVRIINNAGSGLEVLYSDVHNSFSYIRNSEFSDNKGAGIFFKQLGLTIQGK